MVELAHRIVVVTGVTSGIGKALTERLIAAQSLVVGIARNAAKLAALAEAHGPAFVPCCVDLADRPARRRTFSELRDRLPRADVIVNNAAEVAYATPLGFEQTRFDALLEVNTLAAMDLVHTFAPALAAEAQIVNVSSVTARHVAHSRFAPYALTKAALERFTEAVRLELAPRGIRVSLVVPGLVDTPIYDKVAGFEAARETLTQQIPTWLTPEDVADSICWLLTRPVSVTVSELTLLPRFQAR